MSNLRSKSSILRLYSWLPLIVLFLSVLNEFDLNYLCPSVDDYPWDDDEVNDLFQDFLWDYL